MLNTLSAVYSALFLAGCSQPTGDSYSALAEETGRVCDFSNSVQLEDFDPGLQILEK